MQTLLYVMIQGSIHEEDLEILKRYSPNNRVTKYIKQKLIKLKRQLDKFPVAIGELKPSLDN